MNDLDDDLDDDELLREALRAADDGAPWEVEIDGERFRWGGPFPYSRRAALAGIGRWRDGAVQLVAPVEVPLPFPEEAARRSAIALARGVVDDLADAFEGDPAALASLRQALERADAAATSGPSAVAAALDRPRLARLASPLDPDADAVAARRARTDAALNRRAYASAGRALALHALDLAAREHPDAAILDLLELRRRAVWPRHALEHNLDTFYGEAEAGFDDLFAFFDDTAAAWEIIGALLKASRRECAARLGG